MESDNNVENVHKKMADQVSIQIEKTLGNLPPTSPVKKIFKVHNQLRKGSEKAHEPKYVGIGPYHYNSQHYMIEQKIHYLKKMLDRSSQNSVGTYVNALREIEDETRQQYDGIGTLSREKFIEIMLLDGCFILEYMLYMCRSKTEAFQRESDLLFSVDWIRRCIKSDLLLLENQLPFKVLTTLYDLTKAGVEQRNLIALVQEVFGYAGNPSSLQHGHCYGHLFDIVYQLYFHTSQTTLSGSRARSDTYPATSEEGEEPAPVALQAMRPIPCASTDTNPITSGEGIEPTTLSGSRASSDTYPAASEEGEEPAPVALQVQAMRPIPCASTDTNPITSGEGIEPTSLSGSRASSDTDPAISEEGEEPARVRLVQAMRPISPPITSGERIEPVPPELCCLRPIPCASTVAYPITSEEGKIPALSSFLIPSAKELEESGIKFSWEGNHAKFLDIVDAKGTSKIQRNSSEGSNAKLLDIDFENGTLKIPPIIIEDDTESLLRNFVVYEQYHRGGKTNYVTEYVHFLDCLISTPKDVELLRQKKIITNLLGDDEAVSKIFNRICDNVIVYHNRSYESVFEKVNEHCSKRRNRWMAILKRDYFQSPWSTISFLAAIVLLLLTVIQTVYTVTSSYKKD